ncbi:MAG TPA: hypothetical protein VM223_10215, partial [Planctomycetota bacterium]|nr:hypothetical protein [Planctomycetota bacterium]
KEDVYVDPYGAPDVISLDGAPVAHPIKGQAGEFEVKNLPVPERFGTYALVLVRGKERQFLATLCRVPKPRPYATADNTPIIGGGEMVEQEHPDHMGAIARMGIRLIRGGARWEINRDTGEYDWTYNDWYYAQLEANGVKCFPSIGPTHGSLWPLKDRPIPATGTAWYWGKSDWSCAPEDYPKYGAWVYEFCKRYWKGGKGGLWGIEHYNEPWEGGGITGWARDGIQYREMLKQIAVNAKKVDPKIKIMAASSEMNTEDKLFSDGTEDMSPYIDVFTSHYSDATYGPAVAASHGKLSLDSECWTVINEYLLPVILSKGLATGQMAISPYHPMTVFEGIPGTKDEFFIPTTVVSATAAFNWFVTGHPFKRIAFRDHLPWVFQFGEDNDPEALLIMFGQLMSVRADNPQKGVDTRPWPQVEGSIGGTMTIDNADGLLSFFDLEGNAVNVGEKSVTLPMSYLPAYIKCAKGPAAAIERIRKAVITGKRPVEILPRDFTTRVTDPAASLTVEVHNCSNRAIDGKLVVTPPAGITLKATEQAVKLAAGEKKPFAFPVAQAKPEPSNNYPFAFRFESDAGAAEYSEMMNVTIAPRLTPKIDGDLAEWENVPGITLTAAREEIDLNELARRPWMEWREKQPDGTYAEVKVAWDAENVYLAARVNDPTPQFDKMMMEGRNDDAFFHGAASDIDPAYAAIKHAHPWFSFAQVPYVYKVDPNRPEYAPWQGDRIHVGFDLTDDWHDLKPTTDRLPERFHAFPDTDYEFSFYAVACHETDKVEQWEKEIAQKTRRMQRFPAEAANLQRQIDADRKKLDEFYKGKHISECWTLLAPGIPRIHDYPRQVKGKVTTHPTIGVQKAVVQDGTVRFYELAIPKAELKDLKLAPGTVFGFTFQIGNDDGPSIFYGEQKAVCGQQILTLHPYWWSTPSQGMKWALVE